MTGRRRQTVHALASTSGPERNHSGEMLRSVVLRQDKKTPVSASL